MPKEPPSQIPTGAMLWRLKAPGVAGARTPHHSSVGPKTHLEKGAKRGSWGSANEDFKAAPLSTCPCALSGPGDRDSLGQEVRM